MQTHEAWNLGTTTVRLEGWERTRDGDCRGLRRRAGFTESPAAAVLGRAETVSLRMRRLCPGPRAQLGLRATTQSHHSIVGSAVGFVEGRIQEAGHRQQAAEDDMS